MNNIINKKLLVGYLTIFFIGSNTMIFGYNKDYKSSNTMVVDKNNEDYQGLFLIKQDDGQEFQDNKDDYHKNFPWKIIFITLAIPLALLLIYCLLQWSKNHQSNGVDNNTNPIGDNRDQNYNSIGSHGVVTDKQIKKMEKELKNFNLKKNEINYSNGICNIKQIEYKRSNKEFTISDKNSINNIKELNQLMYDFRELFLFITTTRRMITDESDKKVFIQSFFNKLLKINNNHIININNIDQFYNNTYQNDINSDYDIDKPEIIVNQWNIFKKNPNQ